MQTLLTRTRPKPTSAEIFRDLEFTIYRSRAGRLMALPNRAEVDDQYFDEINDLIVDVEEALRPDDMRPRWLDLLYQRWAQRPPRAVDSEEGA